jgi:hypothetical protein
VLRGPPPAATSSPDALHPPPPRARKVGQANSLGTALCFVEQTRRIIRHFQEQQKRELFHVVAVGKAIVSEDVAAIPEFLDELWCGV